METAAAAETLAAPATEAQAAIATTASETERAQVGTRHKYQGLMSVTMATASQQVTWFLRSML